MKAMNKKEFCISETTRKLLRMSLQEDVGPGDVTSNVLIPAKDIAKAVVVAKEPGIFCGAPVLRELFLMADPDLKVRFPVPEGGKFRKNTVVIGLKGDAHSILKSERTAINLLGHLSGIATKTRLFVNAVKRYPVLILDTRKTTPLWREIEKYAVRIGGGRNHRMGLYDAILVKENHRLHADFRRLKSYERQFEIEVRNQKELREALKMNPRVVLFDNFTPAQTKKAVALTRRKSPATIIEASGGVTLENVVHYAAMGVDWISIGALTRSVKSIDFSLLVT